MLHWLGSTDVVWKSIMCMTWTLVSSVSVKVLPTSKSGFLHVSIYAQYWCVFGHNSVNNRQTKIVIRDMKMLGHRIKTVTFMHKNTNQCIKSCSYFTNPAFELGWHAWPPPVSSFKSLSEMGEWSLPCTQTSAACDYCTDGGSWILLTHRSTLPGRLQKH